MSTSISEISRIVRHNPADLKYLFKSPTEDKKRLTRIISKLVPYRVGVEFETFGAVAQYLYPKDFDITKGVCISKSHKNYNDLIKNYLRVKSFKEDEHIYHDDNGDELIDNPHYGRISVIDSHLNEVRVSFMGYKQLIPFWNSLKIFKDCLVIPAHKGGIHIHIDASFLNSDKAERFAVKWFNRPEILSRVLQIFEGYKGSYNKRGADTSKGSWIRVTPYNSIEFRIGRLTYDYATIMRWIISCSELVSQCKSDCLKNNRIKHKLRKLAQACNDNSGITLSIDSDDYISTEYTRLSQEVADLRRTNQSLIEFIHNPHLLQSTSDYSIYTNDGSRWLY